MSKRITSAVVAVLLVLLVIIVNMVNGFEGKQEESRKMIVGLVIPGLSTESGWNGDHFTSVKRVTDELGAELILMENVKEGSGELEKAVDELAKSGTQMILLGSYNYPSEISDYMKTHKDVSFYGISSDVEVPNFKAYSARAYQARYLSGVIAALHSKTGKLGYVAAMSNSEVNRGINAFALGARRVNPKVKVYVAWTNSWDDSIVEKLNVDKLVQKVGVDVLGYHQNRLNVVDEADSLGVMSVAYSMKESSYSPNVLASTATNWGNVYKEIILDFLQKKNSVSNYWVGADKDAIEIQFFSDAVSDSARQVVEGVLDSLKHGMDVFTGPMYDNRHRKRCEKNEVVSDLILRDEMNWFVEGVTIYEDK